MFRRWWTIRWMRDGIWNAFVCCTLLDEMGCRSFLVIHLLMEIGVDRY
jgi:hypothetical protein